MTAPGNRLAAAALDLVGCRFRLHGRDPGSGLDCIGLLAAAMNRAGMPVTLPTGYPLRLRALEGWLPDPADLGFETAELPFRPGDVVLLAPGPAQFHLAIAAAPDGWVHAHAGLRRAVHAPALPVVPIILHWRLAPSR